MITENEIEVDVDLDILPRCEHRNHGDLNNDAPAEYLLRAWCPSCGDTQKLIICDPCYRDGLEASLECDCGYIGIAEEMWMVICRL